jgi:hypothetical protein
VTRNLPGTKGLRRKRVPFPTRSFPPVG